MQYLALLRGINVGGKNKVDMKQLKAACEKLGLDDVRTYINSGNVIFSAEEHSTEELAPLLEGAVEREFGVTNPILIKHADAVAAVASAVPEGWVNDKTMKCDVLFLWEDVDDPAILDRLPIREGIDQAIYAPGAVIWKVDRSDVTRSGLPRIVGTDLYRAVTVRNINTVRKLHALLDA